MSKVNEVEHQRRREEDRKRVREAVEALQSSDGWKGWLASRKHFHAYSLANQLLIAAQCPSATRVAGFRAWLKLGYCVKRGERALRIWAPMPPSKKALEAWREAGGAPKDRPRPRFRMAAVFDRSQVAPLPAPAVALPLDPPITDVEGEDLAWAVPRLEALATAIGSAVNIVELPPSIGGSYEPATRRIWLNAATTVNQRVKTLVHELGHALLRVDEDVSSLALGYAGEELVVESVAYTVCGSIGLDTAGYSVPYLASWAEAASLDVLEQTAGLIDRLAKRLEDAVGEIPTGDVGRLCDWEAA